MLHLNRASSSILTPEKDFIFEFSISTDANIFASIKHPFLLLIKDFLTYNLQKFLISQKKLKVSIFVVSISKEALPKIFVKEPELEKISLSFIFIEELDTSSNMLLQIELILDLKIKRLALSAKKKAFCCVLHKTFVKVTIELL